MVKFVELPKWAQLWIVLRFIVMYPGLAWFYLHEEEEGVDILDKKVKEA